MTTTASLDVIDDSRFHALCEGIVRDMQRLKVPGAAIGLYHQGQEITAGLGVTSLQHPLPVTPDTLFQIGSISKTFTATVIMMLVEQGKVDLDAPVRKYIKDLKLRDKDVQQRVTVRHLLTHVGGWVGDYFNDFGPGEDALAKLVKEIGRLPQVHPLGSIWSYNNTGFVLASRLIELVTRKPYETAMQEMLFDLLGLRMSFFYPNDMIFLHRFAVGHEKDGDKVTVARPWAPSRAENGVGGVITTVRDLLRYARFHMSNGKKNVLSADGLRLMRVPQVHIGGGEQMCISWFARTEGGLQIFEHSGSVNSQEAELFFIPAKKFALALLTNSDYGYNVARPAYKQALRLYFDTEVEVPSPAAIPPALLAQYAGRYKIGVGCFDLKVRGKHLVFHEVPMGGFPKPDSPPGPLTPPIRLAFYGPDQVVGLDEPYQDGLGEFLRDEKGRIRYCRIFGRAHKKIS